MAHEPIGGTKDDLDTPSLCVDLARMEANIRRMAGFCRAHGKAWRPHAKCHKVPAIALKEVEAGAIGVTCAKVSEAEVMAAGGVRDILIANQIVGRRKVARLAALARWCDPIATVDHPVQVEQLDMACRAIGVQVRTIIEVDLGMKRSGVEPSPSHALPGWGRRQGEGQSGPVLDLARQIDKARGLRLAGIMGYEGHLLALADAAEKRQRIACAMRTLLAVRDDLLAAGLPCEIVSAGGTGSYQITATMPGVTEIQGGGGIFMDPYYREACGVQDLEYALTVLCTVTSRPAPGRAIIDAGRKTMNHELRMPVVVGREDIRITSLSAEHGTLTLGPSAEDLAVGDRLELVVGYGDFTTCLHDELYGFRDGRLEVVWPILGRGKIR